MTSKREYLVALTARSTQQAWIAARSEATATRKAEKLWAENDTLFDLTGGSLEDITILETREVRS